VEPGHAERLAFGLLWGNIGSKHLSPAFRANLIGNEFPSIVWSDLEEDFTPWGVDSSERLPFQSGWN
jgi:hypothetical protein